MLYILLKKPAAVKLIEAELGTEPFLVGKHNQLFQVIKKQAEGDENALIGEPPELLKTLRKVNLGILLFCRMLVRIFNEFGNGG